MTLNFRRQGETGPMYNPERDYAYITPAIFCAAITNLERQELPEGCTKDDLVGITTALANAQRNFVNAAAPVASLEEALTKHGFYDFPAALQHALFAAIGYVICGAWFKAVREVSIVGEESPASNDMARFSATVREFAGRVDAKHIDPDYTVERITMLNDVLQARINQLGSHILLLQQELRVADAAMSVKRQSLVSRLFAFLKRGR